MQQALLKINVKLSEFKTKKTLLRHRRLGFKSGAERCELTWTGNEAEVFRDEDSKTRTPEDSGRWLEGWDGEAAARCPLRSPPVRFPCTPHSWPHAAVPLLIMRASQWEPVSASSVPPTCWPVSTVTKSQRRWIRATALWNLSSIICVTYTESLAAAFSLF